MITIDSKTKSTEITRNTDGSWKVTAKQFDGSDWVTVANMNFGGFCEADNWASDFVNS